MSIHQYICPGRRPIDGEYLLKTEGIEEPAAITISAAQVKDSKRWPIVLKELLQVILTALIELCSDLHIGQGHGRFSGFLRSKKPSSSDLIPIERFNG